MYKITLVIDGMTCGMCEAHVNDTVRKNFNIKKVTSSRKKKQTVIISPEVISRDAVTSAIAQTGYTVTGYTCEPHDKKSIFS